MTTKTDSQIQAGNRADPELSHVVHEALGYARAVLADLQRPPHNVSKQEVAAAIKEALERHADREAESILLDVSGGQVTLTGRVNTWAEREAAIDAAWGTHGVGIVIDHLRIEP